MLENRPPLRLQNDNRTPDPEPAREDDFSDIVTCNSAMREQLRYVRLIGPTQRPVLILGETGAGKELFAQALHRAGNRSGPFVAVNLAGLDDNMFSDTLFGHKKGTFSGAETDREGLVSRAAQGTLFLDEIGDIEAAAQIRLLRLIQEREYYPLGCDTPVNSEARIVVATNRDLESAMVKGTFREDLYYRLAAHRVCIPPLRCRKDDIPLLLESFIRAAADSLGLAAPGYHQELVTLLSSYTFPGNVRELQSMVFEAVTRNGSGKLTQELFREIIGRQRQVAQAAGEGEPYRPSDTPDGISFACFPTLKEAEEVIIDKSLEIAKSNQGVAAAMLGISRQALNRRLQLMKG